MEKYSYGLVTAKTGTIDAATGLGTGMADMGSVYKDSMEITDSDPVQTPFYSQQDPTNPKLIINGGGNTTVKLSLMDTSAANLKKYCGGDITVVNLLPTWSPPATPPTIELPFEFVTSDGAKIEISRGSVIAKKIMPVKNDAIWVLELTITPLTSKVTGVKTMRISDPTA